MSQTLIRNWWLLALCGIADATISFIYLNDASRSAAWLGILALAAGILTIAAGVRSFNGKTWLLVLNGLALSALGVIYYFLVRSPIPVRFRTIALLIILMALSAGILAWAGARGLRRQYHAADQRLLRLAGVAWFAFALAFLALGFRWIRIEPGSNTDLLWLAAYFGFSAISMLALALRLHRFRTLPTA